MIMLCRSERTGAELMVRFVSAYTTPFVWVLNIRYYHHRMDVGMDSSNIFC